MRYRYTGKERDAETGLNYHGTRYYASWFARWISTDPIQLQGGINFYAYASCSPIGKIDSTGNAGQTKMGPVVMPPNTAASGTHAHEVVLPTVADRINEAHGDFYNARTEVRTLPGGSSKPGSWSPGEIDLPIDTAGRGQQLYDLKPQGTSSKYSSQMFNYGQTADTPLSAKPGTILREMPEVLEPVVNGKETYLLSLPKEDGFIEYTRMVEVEPKTPVVEYKPQLSPATAPKPTVAPTAAPEVPLPKTPTAVPELPAIVEPVPAASAASSDCR